MVLAIRNSMFIKLAMLTQLCLNLRPIQKHHHMRIRNLLFVLFISVPFWGWSQSKSKRPQVLVYGSGVDAYAAALQSAKSNLNTVWVLEGSQVAPALTAQPTTVTSGANLDAGLWADFLAQTLNHEGRSDSLSAIAKKRINPQIAQNVIDSTLKTVDNLTIIEGKKPDEIRKRGKYWQLTLSSREQVRVQAVVDASADAYLFQLAYGTTDSLKTRAVIEPAYFQGSDYDERSRTGVAVGYTAQQPYTLPLAAIVPAGDSNLFMTRTASTLQALLTGGPEDIPLLMHVGQAVGAAAAYTAFFETTSDKLDARKIQGELLQYGARIMPFTDVQIDDNNFVSIQRIGATGLLKGINDGLGNLQFNPEAPVSAAEIKPVLNQLFSRSQIWFIDHPDVDTLRLSDLFSLIKYIGHRGDELEKQVAKSWSRTFHLEGEYDENHIATRRLVAVLLDAYCKPFDVNVGLTGVLQR